jgi:hypothetical protein
VLKGTAEAFMPNIAEALGMSMADLSESIPMVGQALAVVFKIIDGLLHASEFNERQETQTCTYLQDIFKATGTGSILGGGSIVPADIFAPVHKMIDSYSGDWLKYAQEAAASQYSGVGLEIDRKGNPMSSGPVLGCSAYCSTFGQALMLLTEGAQVDVEDIDFKWLRALDKKYPGIKPRPYVLLFTNDDDDDPFSDKVKPYPTSGRAWSKMAEETIEITDKPFSILLGGKKVGIEPHRRKQLQKIRRAIRESYRPGAYGDKSDGGAAMWLVYLDILRDLVKTGAIPPEYISYVLVRRQYAYVPLKGFGTVLFGWNPKYLAPTQSGLHTCAANATNQILAAVQQWDNSAAPRYAQGQAKIDDIKREAEKIGRRAASDAHRSFAGSIADGIRSLLGDG